MNTKTIRQQILEYLASRHAASADELSRILHVTPANIRYHLGILKQEGKVCLSEQIPAQGKGRPKKLYRLSPSHAEHNLDILAKGLLSAMKAKVDMDCLQDIRVYTAEKIASAFPIPASTSPSQRLNQLIQYLNDMHYKARWEAHKFGPKIIFQQCPYFAILQDHPEICQIDQHLLEILLAMPIQQTAKLETHSQGFRFCSFQARL